METAQVSRVKEEEKVYKFIVDPLMRQASLTGDWCPVAEFTDFLSYPIFNENRPVLKNEVSLRDSMIRLASIFEVMGKVQNIINVPASPDEY